MKKTIIALTIALAASSAGAQANYPNPCPAGPHAWDDLDMRCMLYLVDGCLYDGLLQYEGQYRDGTPLTDCGEILTLIYEDPAYREMAMRRDCYSVPVAPKPGQERDKNAGDSE